MTNGLDTLQEEEFRLTEEESAGVQRRGVSGIEEEVAPPNFQEYVETNFPNIDPDSTSQFKSITNQFLEENLSGLDSASKKRAKLLNKLDLENQGIRTYRDVLEPPPTGVEELAPGMAPGIVGVEPEEPSLIGGAARAVARGAVRIVGTPSELLDIGEKALTNAINLLLPERYEIRGPGKIERFVLSPSEAATERFFPRSADAQKPIAEGIKDANWWVENTTEALTSLIPAVMSGIGMARWTNDGRKALTTMADYAAGRVGKQAAIAAQKELSRLAGKGVLISSTALSTAEQQKQYRDWLDNNPDAAESLAAQMNVIGTGMAVGAIESVADKFLLMPMFRRKFGAAARERASTFFGRLLNQLSGRGKGALVEGGTEQFQQIVGDTLSRLGYDEDREIFNREKLADGILGGLVGFIARGGDVVSTNEIRRGRLIVEGDPEYDVRYARQPGSTQESVEDFISQSSGIEIEKRPPQERPRVIDKFSYSEGDVQQAKDNRERLLSGRNFDVTFGDIITTRAPDGQTVPNQEKIAQLSTIYRDRGVDAAIDWLGKQKITGRDAAVEILEEIAKPLRSGTQFQDTSEEDFNTGLNNHALIESLADTKSEFNQQIPVSVAGRIARLAQGNDPNALIKELQTSAETNPDNRLQLESAANQVERMLRPAEPRDLTPEEQEAEFERNRRLDAKNRSLREETKKVAEATGEPIIETVDPGTPKAQPDRKFSTKEELMLYLDRVRSRDVIQPGESGLDTQRNELERRADEFEARLARTGLYSTEQRRDMREKFLAQEAISRDLFATVGTEARVPLTRTEAQVELQEKLGADNVTRLINTGRVAITESPDEMPDNIRDFYFLNEEQPAAVYDHGTDTIYLMPQNINKGSAFNILAHEVTHARHKDIWRDGGEKILNSFSSRKGTDRRVMAAYEMVPEWTLEEDIDNEALAYYVQDVANATQPLYKQIITQIKKFLVDFLGVDARIINEADLGVIYSSAVHRFAREQAENRGTTILEPERKVETITTDEGIDKLQATTMDGPPKMVQPEEPVGEEMNDAKRLGPFKKVLVRNFKNAGLLEVIFGRGGERAVARHIASQESSTFNGSNEANDLTQTMKTYYGKKKFTEKEQELFHNALKGGEDAQLEIAENSPEASRFLTGQRARIDNLSTNLIRALDRNIQRYQDRLSRTTDDKVGEVLERQIERAERLRNTIIGNISHYLNTSFEAYSNPFYLTKIKPGTDKYNKFVDQFSIEVAAKNPDVDARVQAQATASQIYQYLEESRDLSQYFGTSQIYKARNGELSPAIKEFLGEVKDPAVAVNQTIVKMRKQLAQNLFHESILDLGTRAGWISEAAIPNSVVYGQETANVFSPLNGLNVDRDIVQGFNDMNVSPYTEGLGGLANMLQTIFRFMNVPLNAGTYNLAIIGNFSYFAANGMLNPAKVVRGQELLTQYKEQLGKRKYDELMTALGIGKSGVAEELSIRLDSTSKFLDDFIRNKIVRAANRAGDITGIENVDTAVSKFTSSVSDLTGILAGKTVDAYGSIDPYFKQKALFFNLAELQDAKAGKWTETRMLEEAADITNKTFQNYARLPRFIRQIRMFTKEGGLIKNALVPFTNTFISFAGDLGRMTWDTAKKTYELYQDPDLRPMAKRMLASQIIVYGAVAGMAQGLFNDDEDPEQLKDTWMAGDIGILSGDYMYNMQYILPQTMVAKLLINPTIEMGKIAFGQSDDVQADMRVVFNSIAAGMIDEFGNNMIAQPFKNGLAAYERGTDAIDSGDRFFEAFLGTTVKTLTPGTLRALDGMWAGIRNSNRGYVVEKKMPFIAEDEALKLMGVKRYPATYFSSAHKSAQNLRSRVNDQEFKWNNTLTDIDKFNPDFVESFLIEAQENHNRWWTSYINTKNIFTKPGKMSRRQFMESANDPIANIRLISAEDMSSVMANRIPPFDLPGTDKIIAEKRRLQKQVGKAYDQLLIDELSARLDANLREVRRIFRELGIRERRR